MHGQLGQGSSWPSSSGHQAGLSLRLTSEAADQCGGVVPGQMSKVEAAAPGFYSAEVAEDCLDLFGRGSHFGE